MSKIRDFFVNLNKSTKITLVSCGCFIAMTALILVFFILFPITPSEKVIASFGRESIVRKESSEVQSPVTTTADSSVELSKGTTYTRASQTTAKTTTRRKRFEMDVTTGSGFYSGGNILTGQYPYESGYGYTTTTTTAYPDPGYTGEEPTASEEPTTGNYGPGPGTEPDPGITVEPGTDNPGGDDPITDPDPVDPGVTPDPVDPGVTPDPDPQTPPPESGGEADVTE